MSFSLVTGVAAVGVQAVVAAASSCCSFSVERRHEAGRLQAHIGRELTRDADAVSVHHQSSALLQSRLHLLLRLLPLHTPREPQVKGHQHAAPTE